MKLETGPPICLNFMLDKPKTWNEEFTRLYNYSTAVPFNKSLNLHILVDFEDEENQQNLISAGQTMPIFTQHFMRRICAPIILERLGNLHFMSHVPVFCGVGSFLMEHTFPVLEEIVLEIYKPKNFDSTFHLYQDALRRFRISSRNYPTLTMLHLIGMFDTGFMGRNYADTRSKFPWNQITKIALEEWVCRGPEDMCYVLSLCPNLQHCRIRYTGLDSAVEDNPQISMCETRPILLPNLQLLHVDLTHEGDLLPLFHTLSTPILNTLIIKTSPRQEVGACPMPALQALKDSSGGLTRLRVLTTMKFNWSTISNLARAM
ncbi:hypothetical protein BDN72DRAFT_861606 [Pluteus cervinus]|uniref:Uncharacterized protein n=1 Tax=Pluteus cervinus TaxID=181527 RepID=A0ACD3AE14_9AGAR|nr:hypothetical protein BDN72DRAFT_861606 [Pluteus cervinus]